MEWCAIKESAYQALQFPTKDALHESTEKHPREIGGIINHGKWAWLARNCTLQINLLHCSQTLLTYKFSNYNKIFAGCHIKCVEVVIPHNAESIYLAVCLNTSCDCEERSSFVILYSVERNEVLNCIQLQSHITCVRFVDYACCRRSLLQNFDGCLVIGHENGKVNLLNLKMQKLMTMSAEQGANKNLMSCYLIDYNLPLAEIHRNFQQYRMSGEYFGLQLETIESPCSISSILPINLILGLAVGFEDGRLAFYDLMELQIFYIAVTHETRLMSPLVKMDFIEPLDDPRACLYVWTMHESNNNLSAALHVLMYEKRLMAEDGSWIFETFQSSTVRLHLPLESTKSIAIKCQSITKINSQADDDSYFLCALLWQSVFEKKHKLLLFDLNQWYKEEMPYVLDLHRSSSYLAGYILSGLQYGLDSYMLPSTIVHFNSFQRSEEHFYPNSLSFECILLGEGSFRTFIWEGAQNKVINCLRAGNASIFLDPEPYFKEILRTHLLPQFSDFNVNSTISKNAKYEVILSVALEYNCFNLLRDCAKSWVDGSFTGNALSSANITLFILTDWIWKRATDIKAHSSGLCKELFGYVGCPLNRRQQRELGLLTRQLALLANLLSEVLASAKNYIPYSAYTSIESKYKLLQTASEYQEIVLWSINIGLLPERSSNSFEVGNQNLVPYPYEYLNKLYTEKRLLFGQISENFVSKKTGSCRLIFIDSFIEHKCKGSVLREYWLENNGNGLYPPVSIESMLRIMLVPEVDFETKCAILLYFFLDLHTTINEEAYNVVVEQFIKFPSVFKLSASIIKTVQAFWNLDHGHFLHAVDEFISPFTNNQNSPQWLIELLIECLLTQDFANLALRILEARSTLISPLLKLKTLLSNELLAEAFHFVRSQQDDSLLEIFFTCCLYSGKYSVIRNLSLNEKEGQLVQNILKRSKIRGAENLHFVYLLQKSKFLEAVSYMDELAKTKCMRANFSGAFNMETPNFVLSALNTAMIPVTQGLTDVYFQIKNKIKKKETKNRSPVPLSCQLIKQNANKLLGGIYHSSALSAHFATNYWSELNHRKPDCINLLNSSNAPFLRKPQVETSHTAFMERNTISYPSEYNPSVKRSLMKSELLATDEAEGQLAFENPRKRRRLIEENYVSELKLKMTLNAKETEKNILMQPLNPKHNLIANYHAHERKTTDCELHSILKTNMHDCPREFSPTIDEYKSIRFNLLPTKIDSEGQNDKYLKPTHDNEEDVTKASEQKCITITSSISDDSNSSTKNVNEKTEHNLYSTSPTALRYVSSPSARKPLTQVSLDSPKDSTHFETIKTSPMKIIEFKQKSSSTTKLMKSGYANTDSQVWTPSLSISSTLMDFAPKVSSSRVCESQSKFSNILETVQSHMKLSTNSTVVDSLTSMDLIMPYTTTKCVSAIEEKHKCAPFMDTTLDMSSYDGTVLDASMNVKESLYGVEGEGLKKEKGDIKNYYGGNIHSKEKVAQSNQVNQEDIGPICEEDGPDLKLKKYISNEGYENITMQLQKSQIAKLKTAKTDHTANSNEIIVLSSSSSSSSSSPLPLQLLSSSKQQINEIGDNDDSSEINEDDSNTGDYYEETETDEDNENKKEIGETKNKEKYENKNEKNVEEKEEESKRNETNPESYENKDFQRREEKNTATIEIEHDVEIINDDREITKKVVMYDENDINEDNKLDLQLETQTFLCSYSNKLNSDICTERPKCLKTNCSEEETISVTERASTIKQVKTVEQQVGEDEKKASFENIDTKMSEKTAEERDTAGIARDFQKIKSSDQVVHITDKDEEDEMQSRTYAEERNAGETKENCVILNDATKDVRNTIVEEPSCSKSNNKIHSPVLHIDIQTEQTKNVTPRTKSLLSKFEQHENPRGSLIPPLSMETGNQLHAEFVIRRSTRGISVPLQTEAGSVETNASPQTPQRIIKRSQRNSQHDVNESLSDNKDITTPARLGRSTSVPLEISSVGKIKSRRRSTLLNSLNENHSALDSPSSRTRSRVRLNSTESEFNSSVISNEEQQTRHIRRLSRSSSISEQPQTPTTRRDRSNSKTINLGETTPTRSLRKRKTASNPVIKKITSHEDEESITNSKYMEAKKISDSSAYSSMRRLTRTQLAMLEKSINLIEANKIQDTTTSLVSPSAEKHVKMRRTSRSMVPTDKDNDDVESTSSYLSNNSNTATRRLTRSLTKEMDRDDDVASVDSSIPCERRAKRRSKEKGSPKNILTVIQEIEDENQDKGHIVHKKHEKPSKK